jgi:hypothetical protein
MIHRRKQPQHSNSTHSRCSWRPDLRPYDSHKGTLESEHYRVQRVRLESDFLDIYAVKCLCGHVFEAQAFSLSCPYEWGTKFLESRRRRMKRIYNSSNFVSSFDKSGKRFLVSDVQRTDAEWQDVCHQIRKHQGPDPDKDRRELKTKAYCSPPKAIFDPEVSDRDSLSSFQSLLKPIPNDSPSSPRRLKKGIRLV